MYCQYMTNVVASKNEGLSVKNGYILKWECYQEMPR